MLAEIYVENSPTGYVIMLVVVSPLALVALVFWVLTVIPRLRKYGPPLPKDRIEKAQHITGCSLATLVLLSIVLLSLRALLHTI
ncbi:hypothetical protein [Streptomyces brasiliensis]|uniref:Uncharacterized protein n=1 Tax=Streptomyces brasiliensis TaxID=1954 RepID=A0A917L020_9ACTN|nr:hypothetical protein [Streptomyces brasiliensis]GGJ33327.1 hypothetical protein GCM10010121_050620 [Streptomyces brasiliensis]